ncbi:dynein axonemal light chain 1-like isoform X2 [Planococcus citri]|uniref:dynein axonemal light chain 1-like isoform X2 n=1 Tax=Planococcus citri TaxID=170843 RepID=UPI0031F7E880
MDSNLGNLVNCEKLSLSTNMIEKITGLVGMKHLKVLSVGRNYIKSFAGLDSVADTLEELWISYNFIEKLKGIDVLKKLKVLYMSNNLVKEWAEFNKLQECPCLEDLNFVGNPIHDTLEDAEWRIEVHKRLPNLKKLDGEPIVPDQTF